MNKAQTLWRRAHAIDEAIKAKKLKIYNMPIKHHPFIHTIREWAVKGGETEEQFNNNLGL